MRNCKGVLHSFLSMSALDGPKLRCVVFLQGCNLRCPFCHNPDTFGKEGKEVTAGEVLEKIVRLRPYLTGGVTLSGGEPLLQGEFTFSLLSLLKEEGFHTAIETNGLLFDEWTERILEKTDLVILDVKSLVEGSLAKLKNFLKVAEKRGCDIKLTRVIIPTVSDRKEEMKAFAALAKTFRAQTELLPFHKLCVEKYRALNIPFPMEHVEECSETLLATMKEELKNELEKSL